MYLFLPLSMIPTSSVYVGLPGLLVLLASSKRSKFNDILTWLQTVMWGLRYSWDGNQHQQAVCFLTISFLAAMGSKILLNLSNTTTQQEQMKEALSGTSYKSEFKSKGKRANHKYHRVKTNEQPQTSRNQKKNKRGFYFYMQQLQEVCDNDFNIFDSSLILARLSALSTNFLMSYQIYCMKQLVQFKVKSYIARMAYKQSNLSTGRSSYPKESKDQRIISINKGEV